MSQSTEVLKSLRTTLRHLRRLPSTSSPSSPLKLTITNLIRSSHYDGNEEEIERARKALAAYAETISSVQQLSYLRGLDTGEKMTQSERVKAMSHRMGWSSPKEYTGHDNDEDESK